MWLTRRQGVRNTKPHLTVVAETILPQTWLFCIQLWEWNIQTLKKPKKHYACIFTFLPIPAFDIAFAVQYWVESHLAVICYVKQTLLQVWYQP